MTRSGRVSNILEAIGDTPCVALRNITPAGCAEVYLKMESLNPTGSYKDRMAKAMIDEAERRGDLKPGATVVEATGGSTGSSLALVCAIKGYKFHVVSSDAFAAEKLRTMAAFGAELNLIESAKDGLTPHLIPNMRVRAAELVKSKGYYATDQFTNADILAGFAPMGHELLEQFPEGIDAFCGSVGTAGMLMGVSRILKAKRLDTKVVALEPASAPVISKGQQGTHRVDGIGPGFVPPLLDLDFYDEARGISEEEARVMCRRLARKEGMLVGTSTGLNVVAALELARELGPGKVVVTVACDTGLKYLRGDLFSDPEGA